MSIAAPIKWAGINVTGTAKEIVPGVIGKRIRVVAITFTFTDAGTVTFLSGTTVQINGMPFAANGGMNFLGNDYFWFVGTNVGEALNATVSAGTMVGSLNYIEV